MVTCGSGDQGFLTTLLHRAITSSGNCQLPSPVVSFVVLMLPPNGEE
jgi:hypothetical protein